ncbi:MAG: glycosyltransferase family 4 protein [Candidatus Methanofastidiosa archaeon]|nr:glycosyltransferase family 4 protein [Candidatus Methanofastidiosa archaeon]
MKLLYIATSFPEPHKGDTIYTDLAEALREAGHKIVVVVSEQSKNKKRTEIKEERGFKVLRVVTGNYYDVGFIEKGITTLKIPILMLLNIRKYLKNDKFDLILFESPPITLAGLVAWAKKIFLCPAYLMLKDIFPQNSVDLNIMKNRGLIYSYFAKKEKQLYRTADMIGCMSEANRKYIIDHHPWLGDKKLEIFPNTKKIIKDYCEESLTIRKIYKIPDDVCVFLFGGNMGRPQYIDLLCYAVTKCASKKDIFFVFIGRGTERYKLEQTIAKNNIKNALLLENLPRNDYERIVKACDIGLIILDPSFTIPNYPSRILSYMEYAKPVLAATDKVSDIKELIYDANCGEWVWSGNKEAFLDKIMQMANRSDLDILGRNGRNYLEANLQVDRSVQILERYYQRIEECKTNV